MSDTFATRPMTPIETGMKKSGRLKRPVSAVLFDVYGTLFISASGDISTVKAQWETGETARQLVEEFDIKQAPADLLNRFFHAIETAHARMKAQGIDHPEVETDKIWQQVLDTPDNARARAVALYFEKTVNPAWPMPNLEATLSRIQGSDLRAGIISNAQFYTRHLFDEFLGEQPETSWADPDLVFYSYTYGYAKPSLYLYRLAAKQLAAKGIQSDAALYMGNDMLNDIYPAQQCGFQTALFAGDARSLRLRKDDKRCEGLAPDIVITDLSQLNKYLFEH
ncbi:MAG: HAD family hydrolase [Thermodesulfobacteriota bacterium]|nr:HAD family hydrolase [Thermodesulfobacteriota bacterium]